MTTATRKSPWLTVTRAMVTSAPAMTVPVRSFTTTRARLSGCTFSPSSRVMKLTRLLRSPGGTTMLTVAASTAAASAPSRPALMALAMRLAVV